MATKQSQKKKLIKVFIEYGIHFWLLIFICNVAIFYAFRFFIMASTDLPADNNPAIAITPQISTTAEETLEPEATLTPLVSGKPPTSTPSPTPIGPVINLSFSLPGIGTNGGNLKPIHPVRDIKVMIYPADSDSADNRVKPLSTIQTRATFDDNPNSPTYTEFINPYIELGEVAAKLDEFQVTFKTPQALMKLIKEEGSKSPGGRIIRGHKRYLADLLHQKVIIGDIYPVGISDNIMDINDYNMLVNCFSSKAGTNLCTNQAATDLDDNGVIDGVDYNLMLLSFNQLLSMGYPVPTLGQANKIIVNPTAANIASKIKSFVNPTSKPTAKPTSKPTSTPVKKTSGGGLGGIFIFFFILLIILGIGLFIAFKFGFLNKLLKRTPKTPPDNTSSGTPPAVDQPSETPAPADTTAANNPSPDTQATTVFSKTDNQPPANNDQNNTAEDQQPATDPQNPAGDASPTDQGTVEKSGYLKKGQPDEKGNGIWVTLADDTGITRALYHGKTIEDGFFKIKGTMKNDEENKPYIEIAQADPED